MRVLVIDVAAETGGAKTVLESFIKQCQLDKNNQYDIVLSKGNYVNKHNVCFHYYPWVKKGWAYRLCFDLLWVRIIVNRFEPDLIISLQNNGILYKGINQQVYFHNALLLSDYKVSFKQSKILWFYQKYISKYCRYSLKYVDSIIVQSNWIREELIGKWKIESNRIIVNRPVISIPTTCGISDPLGRIVFFYPANFQIYKNHENLIIAFKQFYDKQGNNNIELILTNSFESAPSRIKKLVDEMYPIKFVGSLNQEEMVEMYRRSVLVFPSYVESAGLPLYEAMACNAWVLCSDLEYAKEATAMYKKIIYFSPESIDSIENALETVIEKLL